MSPVRITLAAAVSAVALVALPGCSVLRHQETVGQYTDDASITGRNVASSGPTPASFHAAFPSRGRNRTPLDQTVGSMSPTCTAPAINTLTATQTMRFSIG